MRVRIRGSAAGGGLPQWNCNCWNCAAARREKGKVASRTQASLAVSGDGQHWVLLNASPDLRQQIAAAAALQPEATAGLRGSPIAAVILTGAEVDQVVGLLNLREGQALGIYSSKQVLAVLEANPIFEVLNPAVVARHPVQLEAPFEVERVPGLKFELFAVAGKIPLWLETAGTEPESDGAHAATLGLTVSEPATGRSFCYVPSCARVDEVLARRLDGAALVLFDGTLFTDDEMIEAKLSHKTGTRMGHMSISGPEGAMTALNPLDIGRRMFIHINNSNPVLQPDSAERALVEAAGWEIAEDGMEIEL